MQRSNKYKRLTQLSQDFVEMVRNMLGASRVTQTHTCLQARTYGRVIISELGLPVGAKTIPPANIGGKAGGLKFIARGSMSLALVCCP